MENPRDENHLAKGQEPPRERTRTTSRKDEDDLARGGAVWSRLVVVAETGSTNSDLAAARRADPAAWPHLSALRAEHQSAGRGRADRVWVTPPGEALTASVLLEPDPGPAARARPAWASLTTVAGLAVVRVLRGLGLDAAVKWPNDVVLRGAPGDGEIDGWGTARKVAGILAEVVPSAGRLPTAERGVRPDGVASDAVVLGIGLNVGQRTLPVPWATSLTLGGLPADAADPARLLDAIGRELVDLLARWREGGFAAVREEAIGVCDTLGRHVRAQQGDGVLDGFAQTLDGEGHLVVLTPDGARVTVAAGDVVHLRTRSGRE